MNDGTRVALAGVLLSLALTSGCAAQGRSSGSPAELAEKITRAVYANDLDTTVASFDDQAKRTVTRSELGLVSDKMHALGDIQGFTQRSADPDKGRYDFDVRFTSGAMLVQLRIDPTGKIGGYYVAPEANPAPTATGSTTNS